LAETLLTHAGGERRMAMNAIGLAIAELVPVEYRGVYGSAGDFSDAARVLQAARGRA
jgi:hypothetical protein